MPVYGVSYVIQIVCLREYAPPEKKVWASLSALFALGFAVLTGSITLSSSRRCGSRSRSGSMRELIQIVMSYPISAAAAVNMLGWTVFSGLGSLFISFSLGSEKACRWSFFINGVVMLVGCIGYATDWFTVTFFCMYLGLGGTVFAMSVARFVLYRKRLKG